MLPLGLFRRRNFTVGEPRDVHRLRRPLDARPSSSCSSSSNSPATRPSRAGSRLSRSPSSCSCSPAARRPAVDAVRAALVHGRSGRSSAPARSCCIRAALPGLLLLDGPAAAAPRFSLGLSLIVAPLTATVLADAGESDAGIASGVNNAIARIAGLLGIAIVGAAIAGSAGNKLDLARLPDRDGDHRRPDRRRRRDRPRRHQEPHPRSSGAAEIVFDRVSKRYPGRAAYALHDLSLDDPGRARSACSSAPRAAARRRR